MEELFNLKYKDEVEDLKEESDYEKLGDEKYIHHEDMEARLYWAFCRPSGSCDEQIQDSHPLVSIMAFNHSRSSALKRFQLIHKDVIKNEDLRIKISKRSRMLFRDLVDNDFKELNEVLNLVPVFLPMAIDQLINGRKWNDIVANEIEATIFLEKIEDLDNQTINALYNKLQNFEELNESEVKKYLENLLINKNSIHKLILEYYFNKVMEYIKNSDIHILQKKTLEVIAKKLI